MRRLLLLASIAAFVVPAASAVQPPRLRVLAAASLTEVFPRIDKRPQYQFAGSHQLAFQIRQGASVDVYAAASPKYPERLYRDGLVEKPIAFATNTLVLVVPKSNPAKIHSASDLAKPGVKVALCAAEVPCGAVARKVFAAAKLTVTPVTNEADVKATLTKVQLGEVDAGVVYVTDVKAAGAKVTGIEIPDDVNASTAYPIATLSSTRNAPLAKAFVDHVLSADGAVVLAESGFRTL